MKKEVNHIYIFGASGSGTTTLGNVLAKKLGYIHFDVDFYYWLPTDPPFLKKREKNKRLDMLKTDLDKQNKWILTGSMTDWGNSLIPLFDLAVYLYIPKDIRIKRLRIRERQRYGNEIDKNGKMNLIFKEFIDWASLYDDSTSLETRTKHYHNEWIKSFKCPILKIIGDTTIEERLNRVINKIDDIIKNK